MTEWLAPAIPYLKAVHVTMLAFWCAGLFAIPLLFSRHGNVVGQEDYTRIRRLTHYGYIYVTTPFAVLAIASGTVLMFARDVFELWLFAKFLFVAALVVFHVWVGYTIVTVAETPGTHHSVDPRRPQIILMVTIIAILFFVLAKPDLGAIPIPDWLKNPRDIQLPFDVPRR